MTVFVNRRCSLMWLLGYRSAFCHNVRKLKDANERADAILREIGLAERRLMPAGLLTYAEQRALEIGITIAGGAEVVMLDEPTAGMSRSETAHFVDLSRKEIGRASCRERGCTDG